MFTDEERAVAIANYTRVNGSEPPAEMGPIGNAALEFVFGKLWDAPGLSWRERRLVSLCCTAINAQTMPLEMHVRGALESGDFTVSDLRALSVHLAAYAGFPVGTAIEVALGKLAADKA